MTNWDPRGNTNSSDYRANSGTRAIENTTLTRPYARGQRWGRVRGRVSFVAFNVK